MDKIDFRFDQPKIQCIINIMRGINWLYTCASPPAHLVVCSCSSAQDRPAGASPTSATWLSSIKSSTQPGTVTPAVSVSFCALKNFEMLHHFLHNTSGSSHLRRKKSLAQFWNFPGFSRTSLKILQDFLNFNVSVHRGPGCRKMVHKPKLFWPNLNFLNSVGCRTHRYM